MIKRIQVLVVGSLLSVLVGCAHPIQLSPDLKELRAQGATQEKSADTVGYYISAADMAKKVTTPGGGGDEVEYTPYADTDAALFTALSNVFADVRKLSTYKPGEPAADGLALVLVPAVVTNSSSTGAFTWPPTDFSYTLTCTAYDAAGTEVWKETVNGTGNAEYDEFISDFSLSARRAVADAMTKLQPAIRSHLTTKP